MQLDKAHLSQSNRIDACFSGQQGTPSAICMASSSAAAAIMVAVRGEYPAAINGAAGPITTPTAIPSARNQRMTARSFMARKIPQVGRIEKPLDPDFGAGRRSVTSRPREHRLAMIALASTTISLSIDLFRNSARCAAEDAENRQQQSEARHHLRAALGPVSLRPTSLAGHDRCRRALLFRCGAMKEHAEAR
jgi:hypothetical protein